MGSKQGILPYIWDAVKHLPFTTVLDAFSGSGCVGYMFKTQGKAVISNDFLKYSYHLANALIANSTETLSEDDRAMLLAENPARQNFIQETFGNIYFDDTDNLFLENTIANIQQLSSPFKQSLALSALNRACIKRRPRGVFTYVGHRYDDGRKDLRLSLQQQFLQAIDILNEAVFDNGQQNLALNQDVFSLDVTPDLVYLDPPYYTPLSDNDYLRRYHFVEGLSCYWQGVEILHHTKTKKLRKYYTPFDSCIEVYGGFERLLKKFSQSILVVSYSSNSLPTRDELTEMLKALKKNVFVHIIPHKYSFGTHAHKVGNQNNTVQEYLFVAY
ncbi:MAG TPA: DNA adenine methylase [Ktedonobacteraceae bacterium]|jgi:DNA adenine methylase|nr:DNA adenine methylase [Ktedonobacteraceae bacterium]